MSSRVVTGKNTVIVLVEQIEGDGQRQIDC